MPDYQDDTIIGAEGTAYHPSSVVISSDTRNKCPPNSFSERDVVVAAWLFLASAVIAIVGICTAVRPVDEQRGSDGWPIGVISRRTPAGGCTGYVSATIWGVGLKRV